MGLLVGHTASGKVAIVDDDTQTLLRMTPAMARAGAEELQRAGAAMGSEDTAEIWLLIWIPALQDLPPDILVESRFRWIGGAGACGRMAGQLLEMATVAEAWAGKAGHA